jgi:glycosyltransferase involved in cell wall biosynthesis
VLQVAPRAVVAFAGGFNDPAYHERIAARVGELGLGEHVRFLGQLEDVRGLLGTASVLAHPSLSEGFGLALVEAMALGVPVVATRCGGPEEIVTADSGELVAAGDPVALGDAVAHLLADEVRRTQLADGARRRAAAFDLTTTASDTADAYEAAVTRRRERQAEAPLRARAAEMVAREVTTRAALAAAPAQPSSSAATSFA